MGQVMKYWQFPERGNGSKSYDCAPYGTLSADFNTDYRIANMPGKVSAENDDVARLCYHLGVSVEMQYTATGSGAYLRNAGEALKNYFQYEGCDYLKRADYTDEQWVTLLKTNLDQGQPVFYGGQSTTSGHAFVVDGYEGNGTFSDYFHFNLGWGGNGDTYNTIDGIKYNLKQEAIFNVKPAGTPAVINRAPIISLEISDKTVAEGFESFFMDLSSYFVDPDGDELTYSIKQSDPQVVELSLSGMNLIVSELGEGSTTITITVSDEKSGTATQSFILTVKAESKNRIPELVTPIENQSKEEGFGSFQITLDNYFTDGDSDLLTFSTIVEKQGIVSVSINEGSLLVNESGTGTTNITITANDGKYGSVSGTFEVEIYPKMLNRAPEVINSSIELNLKNGFIAEAIDLNQVFEDPDGDELIFKPTVNDTAIVDLQLMGNELNIIEKTSGETQLTIFANDQKGGEEKVTFTIQVVNVNNNTFEIDPQLVAYPNPANDFISFSTSLDEAAPVSLMLFDGYGRSVYQNQFNSVNELQNINISSLKKGVYVARLRCDGKETMLRFLKN